MYFRPKLELNDTGLLTKLNWIELIALKNESTRIWQTYHGFETIQLYFRVFIFTPILEHICKL